MTNRLKNRVRDLAQDADVIPKIEGMQVEFDEKVTLFPVELEEIRGVVSDDPGFRTRRAVRRSNA